MKRRYDMTIEDIAGEELNNPAKDIFITKGPFRSRFIFINDLLKHYFSFILFFYVVVSDAHGWNSGIVVLRVSEWNLALFRRIWASEQYIDDVWAEQRALHHFYNTEADVHAHAHARARARARAHAHAHGQTLCLTVGRRMQVRERFVDVPQERMQYVRGAPRHKVSEAEEMDQFVVHFAGAIGHKDRLMAEYYAKIQQSGAWMKR
jgi:hypothetical protein